MKAMMIVVFFSMAIWPVTIYGISDPEDITLDEIYLKVCDVAEKNGKINNVFKPLKKGFLGNGGYSFTYKGKELIILLFLSNIILECFFSFFFFIHQLNNDASGELDLVDQEIAMKFTSPEDESNAEREFEVYTYLGSINQTNKEAFGIPTVYYYGRWEGSVMMAITLLDRKLKNYQMNHMDILIIFREFVRISKYIHSRGICHNDFHQGNLMFRKHQGFIIDYNLAMNMFEPNWAVSPEEFEGWVSLSGRNCMKKDWKEFFTSMCPLAKVKVDYKSVRNTIDSIMRIEHYGLRRVYFEFGKSVFGAEPPHHDKLYKIIDEEIKRCKVPPLVSWLTVTQKNEALFELEHNSIPSIELINDPPANATDAHYVKPIFDFFVKQN